MKKNYLFILAATAIVVGCSDTDSIKEVVTPDVEIGFATFTSKQTRATTDEASENNGSKTVNNLESYNTTFKVWGSKFIGTDENRVFGIDNVGDIVTFSSDKWTYSPTRFWDKSATSYSFYAASPSTQNWVWTNSSSTESKSKKLSLADFEVSGTNRATTAHGTGTTAFGIMNEPAADAIMSKDGEDLMISNDVTGYKDYTKNTVNLHFNHILSRMNIGVRKATILDDFDVKLKSVMVYNMKSNGTFDESLDDANAQGSIARWETAPTTQKKFTDGVGYTNTDGLLIESKESDTNTKYQYVYQGLVIPQAVAYNPTVEVNNYLENQTPAHFRLDGQDKGADANPYIVIEYEIWNKAIAATYYEAGDEIPEGKQEGDVKTPAVTSAKMDGYKYYYNLADVFNGDALTAVNFCEGWQNTLKITLAPVAINFDADVYEWTNDANQEVYVTDQPATNP